jgi:hypothetical protein
MGSNTLPNLNANAMTSVLCECVQFPGLHILECLQFLFLVENQF